LGRSASWNAKIVCICDCKIECETVVLRWVIKAFLTLQMDGWTDIAEEFEIADFVWGGRLFCIMCIVFGNFMFYNIFIAIIIMQISEATDNFRVKRNEFFLSLSD